LAEAIINGKGVIRTLEDKGSYASWAIISIGTAENPGAKEIEAALRSLLGEGEPT